MNCALEEIRINAAKDINGRIVQALEKYVQGFNNMEIDVFKISNRDKTSQKVHCALFFAINRCGHPKSGENQRRICPENCPAVRFKTRFVPYLSPIKRFLNIKPRQNRTKEKPRKPLWFQGH